MVFQINFSGRDGWVVLKDRGLRGEVRGLVFQVCEIAGDLRMALGDSPFSGGFRRVPVGDSREVQRDR
jgi:hypothetical protein